MKAEKFKIGDMRDSDTMNRIKHKLLEYEGIIAVRVDMQADTVSVDYDENDYNSETIKTFINNQGLDVKTVM